MTKLIDYIKGKRHGKEAHRIEREAMQDAFLSDAIDGFDTVKGKHTEQIEKLRKDIARKSQHSSLHWLRYSGIAAALLLCFTIGGYFIYNRQPENYIAKLEKPELPEIKEYTQETIPQNENTESVELKSYDEKSTSRSQLGDGNFSSEKETTKSIQHTESDELAGSDKYAKISTASESPSVAENSGTVQGTIVVAKSQETSKKNVHDKVINEDRQAITQEDNSNHKESVFTSEDISTSIAQKDKKTNKIETPEPAIGWKEYKKYLKNSLRQPTDDKCKKAKGIVKISFYIAENGVPYDYAIEKSICPAADNEAIRLIKEGCRWTYKSFKRMTVEVEF